MHILTRKNSTEQARCNLFAGSKLHIRRLQDWQRNQCGHYWIDVDCPHHFHFHKRSQLRPFTDPRYEVYISEPLFCHINENILAENPVELREIEVKNTAVSHFPVYLPHIY